MNTKVAIIGLCMVLVMPAAAANLLLDANSFLGGGYKNYMGWIDFIVFFFAGFCAALVSGMKFIEHNRSRSAIAIIFGLFFAVGMTQAGYSLLDLGTYIGYGIFVLIAIGIFLVLVTTLLKENRLAALGLCWVIAFLFVLAVGWLLNIQGDGIFDIFINTIERLSFVR